ncbi:MAG: hypothetical protein LBI56_04245, partial [Puniceicoccales bacterium]|nr:hypothetical protein [Puniceicoccales bacterium]
MGKKFLMVVLAWVLCPFVLCGDDFEKIAETLEESQSWEYTGGTAGAILFESNEGDKGALNVPTDGDNTYPEAVAAAGEVNLFFTNDPSVNTGVLDDSEEPNPYNAHIYAFSTALSALGIQTADDTSLSFNNAGKLPTEKEDTEENFKPYNLVVKSPSSATAIGNSHLNEDSGSTPLSPVATKNLILDLGSGSVDNPNTLIAFGETLLWNVNSRYFYSGPATNIVGSSMCAQNIINVWGGAGNAAEVSGGTWTLGDYNVLVADSGKLSSAIQSNYGPGSSSYHHRGSAANVFGVSVNSVHAEKGGHEKNDVAESGNKCSAYVKDSTWVIGSHNTLSAYADGYNTPQDQANQHNYGGIASIFGASCNLAGGGGTGPASIADTQISVGSD